MNTAKFHKKYRIQSARNPTWDYTKQGRYFITICTQGRIPWFGHIHNNMMCVSHIGSIIHQYWAQIPGHFPHVTLDAWIVMPDHMHGIITIGRNVDHDHDIHGIQDVDAGRAMNDVTYSHIDDDHCVYVVQDMDVETFDSNVSTPVGKRKKSIPSRPPSGSLGSIIGQFKSICTKQIWKMGYINFSWQSRFHDIIIRNDVMLINIRRYIHSNVIQYHNQAGTIFIKNTTKL